MKRIIKYSLLAILILAILIPSIAQLSHKNKGKSESKGEVHKGSLGKGYSLPRKGKNFKYFSLFSYYVLRRGYVNSEIYHTVIDTYKDLEKECPDYYFRIMECSRKHGGRMFPHRTHQNGLSMDFMTPLTKGGKQSTFYDKTGIFRYLLNFNDTGQLKLNKKCSIDFEVMAKQILLLDKNAEKYGFRIKKVIFKIELKDDLYKTKSGKLIEEKGIYFAKKLSPVLNNLHDDHYHIDFEKLEN